MHSAGLAVCVQRPHLVQPRWLRPALRPRHVGHAALLRLRGGLRASETHSLRRVSVCAEGDHLGYLRRLSRYANIRNDTM